MLLALGAIALALTPFSERVFKLIAELMMARLPADAKMIAKDVGLAVPRRSGDTHQWVFLAMPIIPYQVWRLIDGWLPVWAPSRRRS
jgi:hypothetical protein